MGGFHNALYHPRRVGLRRAIFQVHLWAGVLLSVYLIVISLSGSVLVFKDELVRWSLPASLRHLPATPVLSPASAMHEFEMVAPGATVSELRAPTAVLPAYLLTGRDAGGRAQRWLLDPVTARVEAAPGGWLETVTDLHNFLLLPRSWGMQVNGVGGAVLLLLSVTGLLLWWPGVRVWGRGLRVNLRANWRRINYDLHNAIGFWTLAIVVWWAISGVYFGWYREVTAAVAAISPLQGMRAPVPAALAPPAAGVKPSLSAVLEAAQRVSPAGRLWSVSDPMLRGEEVYVEMDRRAAGDFSHRDIVRVRAADARVLSVWHYGERHSLGDWVLWSMHPLHFGTVWGMGVKVVWAQLGLALAGLTATGLLMYWNRYLRHRW